MTHEQKIEWMREWCARQDITLELEGECGFGRECVGIMRLDVYPDYAWYEDGQSHGDDVWTPPNAYHKHPCVAVLGRGEEAEAELFDWLQWFDANGYAVESTRLPTHGMSQIEILLGKHTSHRMVRA